MGIIGDIASAGNFLLNTGEALGIGAKARDKRQLEQQGKLNEQAAETNYNWGEKSAQNAYERQLGLYDSRLSPEQQMKSQMEGIKALGLSPALMYGGGGPSGSGAASTAAQGQTGGAQSGQAPNAAEQQQAKAQSMAVALQSARQMAEIKNIQADTKQKEAETSKTTESKDAFIEKLIQEGKAQWLENIKTNWEMAPEDGITSYRHKIYGNTAITPTGAYGKRLAADVASAWGEANNIEALSLLNKNKAEGYWQELLNATSEADSKAIEAAAKKLEAEWHTGTGMNWNSWATVAKDIITSLIRK